MISSIIYAYTQTRPDIAFAVSALSRYYINPNKQHLLAAKRVLRYLAGTSKKGVKFEFGTRDVIKVRDKNRISKPDNEELQLVAYTDSN